MKERGPWRATHVLEATLPDGTTGIVRVMLEGGAPSRLYRRAWTQEEHLQGKTATRWTKTTGLGGWRLDGQPFPGKLAAKNLRSGPTIPNKDRPNKLIAPRLAPESMRRLRVLMRAWGTNMTQTIARALDEARA